MVLRARPQLGIIGPVWEHETTAGAVTSDSEQSTRMSSLRNSATVSVIGDQPAAIDPTGFASLTAAFRMAVVLLFGMALVHAAASRSPAADINEPRRLAASGDYEEALELVTKAIEDNVYGEDWRVLKAELEMTLGRYPTARATLESAVEKYAWSIRLRWQLRDAARFTGDPELAEAQSAAITQLVEASPWRFTDADNLITLGWIALEIGADAREVQEAFFKRAERNNPRHAEPILALANLALEKRDFALAAEKFTKAAESFPDNPDVHYGLAAALFSSDPQAAGEALEQALTCNPRHAPSLLLQADRLIDGERYDDAEFSLNQVLDVNPKHPAALAYWSALAHLKSDHETETALRDEALSTWSTNPEVDYLIGRELSQKYRFAEGAAHQRQALEFDPDYLPARKQLAEDLLRLGKEDEGWRLADEAFEADGYDVAMYNLLALREELERFETTERDGVILRMDARESAVYGRQVHNLLQEAREKLCEKYQLELTEPVTVEIFPQPDDFAVRTFGMPGVSGYLGVCFGNVITANSPAAQLNPSNWEAVLWHEFAHVVTLNLTQNKMPRWLSEGISVYEERQQNPAWGERMNPAYREMILGGELTPIGELSGAFLSPKSSLHVQFAYYQSSIVVEYLIDQFGFDSLLSILNDLREGVYINDAIERHTAPLAQLEPAFAEFARAEAESLAPNVDWDEPHLAPLLADSQGGDAIEEWIGNNPANLRGLVQYARFLMQRERFADARPILEQAVELYPEQTGPDSPLRLLGEVLRELGETEEERSVLTRLAAIDADATPVFLRLIELEAERENWDAVRDNAQRMRAVNPLVAAPHRALAESGEPLNNLEEAADAWQSLIALGPADPAEAHYRLADLLWRLEQPAEARREVMLSLEAAPRFRDAQKLLLKIVRADSPKDAEVK
ncbi:MAG: hypothetical protein DWQ29_14520 [Planctomycetota bacterium]|nr:MAG: hypothetical protein DWQ29_14520 [Planctomycetota bacterium]